MLFICIGLIPQLRSHTYWYHLSSPFEQFQVSKLRKREDHIRPSPSTYSRLDNLKRLEIALLGMNHSISDILGINLWNFNKLPATDISKSMIERLSEGCLHDSLTSGKTRQKNMILHVKNWRSSVNWHSFFWKYFAACDHFWVPNCRKKPSARIWLHGHSINIELTAEQVLESNWHLGFSLIPQLRSHTYWSNRPKKVVKKSINATCALKCLLFL